MSVLEDVYSIRRFYCAPLIPYIFGDKNNYSIGYVTVVFSDDEYDDKSVIERIDAVAVRNGETFEEINLDSMNYPIILNFGADKMNLYQKMAEKYCDLIDDGKFDEAIATFDQIACADLKNLYKKIFKE